MTAWSWVVQSTDTNETTVVCSCMRNITSCVIPLLCLCQQRSLAVLRETQTHVPRSLSLPDGVRWLWNSRRCGGGDISSWLISGLSVCTERYFRSSVTSYINCSITAVNFVIWPVICTNVCAYFAVLPLVLWRKRAATGQSERPRFKLLKMHVDVKRSVKRSFKTEHWTLSLSSQLVLRQCFDAVS